MTSEPPRAAVDSYRKSYDTRVLARDMHNYTTNARSDICGHTFRNNEIDTWDCCANLMFLVSSVLRTYTRYSRESPDILTITNKAKKGTAVVSLLKDRKFYAKCAPATNRFLAYAFVHWLKGKIPKYHRFIRLIFRSVSLTNTITHRRYRIVHIRRKSGGFAIFLREATAYPCIIPHNGQAKDKQQMKMIFTERSQSFLS